MRRDRRRARRSTPSPSPSPPAPVLLASQEHLLLRKQEAGGQQRGMDRGARKGRRRAAPDGRKKRRTTHSFMAQRREGEGAPSPQAHLSSDAHAAAAAAGQGSAAQRDVRGAWRGRASRTAGRRGRESLKLMPTCSAPAGRRGVVVDLQPQRPELTSFFHSDQWIKNSRSNDYRCCHFFFHSIFLSSALIPG